MSFRHYATFSLDLDCDLSERKGRGKGEESCKNKFAKILGEYCQILPGATPTPPRAWFEWVGGKKKSNLLSSFFFRNTMKKKPEKVQVAIFPLVFVQGERQPLIISYSQWDPSLEINKMRRRGRDGWLDSVLHEDRFISLHESYDIILYQPNLNDDGSPMTI